MSLVRGQCVAVSLICFYGVAPKIISTLLWLCVKLISTVQRVSKVSEAL